MSRFICASVTVVAMVLMAGGCATAPKGAEDKASLEQSAKDTIAKFQLADPEIKRFFDDSVAYAVFPSIGKGGLVVGGAYGRGILYEGDRMVGWCDLSQATVGGQIGGQAYDEIIFFQTKQAVDRFKAGQFTFAAQAAAVALKSGAATNAKYQDGVVAFTRPEAGLMAEATVGGQSFTYVPK